MQLLSKLKSTRANRGGFTLIELLVVIGILAILLAITLIAINPSKHFQDSRNAQRSSNVSAILNAIYEYESANNGNVPPSVAHIGTTAVSVAKATSVTATGTSFTTPNLTYTVADSTGFTTGDYVTVSSCDQASDNGTFPVASTTGTTIVVTNANGSATSATGCVVKDVSSAADLCDVTPTFLADLPMDPGASAPTGGTTPCAGSTTAYNTGYTILKTSGGRFTVNAPKAEGGASISVTR